MVACYCECDVGRQIGFQLQVAWSECFLCEFEECEVVPYFVHLYVDGLLLESVELCLIIALLHDSENFSVLAF